LRVHCALANKLIFLCKIVQAYVAYLAPELRDFYTDKFTRVLAHSRKINRERKGGRGGDKKNTGKVDPVAYASSNLLKASNALHEVFAEFIQRSSSFPRQTVARKPMYSLLNLPPPEHGRQPNMSTFCVDEHGHFISIFLRGMEADLIIFYSLLHGCSEMLWDSTILALLIVYCTDRAIVSFRRHFGKVNLMAKTMVDAKFLV
jgi:hypothetical protein